MSDVARPSILVRDGQRLHQVPSGKVRARDVTDLPALYEIIQRIENFFDGSERVEAVQVIDVDVIGAQPLQARLTGRDQVIAR